MIQISKEEYKKSEVQIIDRGKYFQGNRKDLQVESDVVNWAPIFDKCDLEKQKYKQDLTPNAKYQPCRVFVQNDLVEKKIKSCRKSSKRFLEFKKKLGLGPNVVTCDEQDIINVLKLYFKEKLFLLSIALKIKDLMLIFLITNLEEKLMNIIMKVKILIMKEVDN